jgi:hypothetical protein
VTQIPKIVVVVVHGNAHGMAPEHLKDGPLFWLCIDIRPHLTSRAVLDYDFALINLVLNIKILYLDMLGPLRTARLSIGLKQDDTHVVLIDLQCIHVISMLLHEVTCPEDVPQRVVHANKLGFC